MKMYKINSFTTFLFSILIIGVVVFLPIVFIELLWNHTIGKNYIDLTIDFWQSLILWLSALVMLNILGIFKFEFAIQTGETIDNELLRKKLDGLKPGRDDTTKHPEIKPNKDDKVS